MHLYTNYDNASLSAPATTPPSCLRDRVVTGEFLTVSFLARNYGITPGTQYKLVFSESSDTYMFIVGNGVTLGTYTWDHLTKYRETSGSSPDTMTSMLILRPQSGERDISGLVCVRLYGETTFTSPLGVATFLISTSASNHTQ
jgi:hypothetical protein